MDNDVVILGAGITGLSAGLATGAQIYESKNIAGGICASYYANKHGKKSYTPIGKESYRFEMGGGHWIFGADKKILEFIRSITPIKVYERDSAVYFPDTELYVPYPLQNHLSYLPRDTRDGALKEILNAEADGACTLKSWLEASFGKTLCELFFFPFHELYTANLYADIAPQDAFKTPVDRKLLERGAKEKTPAVGYNARFVYPQNGLNDLIGGLAAKCRINYGKKAAKIRLDKKEIQFEDGSCAKYEKVISTLPLNELLKIAGLKSIDPDPFTSVLVINIGARRGVMCPRHHWLYIPKSRSGFHRVGFYSNVDESFLPASSRKDGGRVSIYVEKAYPAGKQPNDSEISQVCDDTVKELKEWQFISETEVVDPTWVETAYTWSYLGSRWKEEALKQLEECGIYSIGRYGKWKFQGIAESMKDGMDVKDGT